MRNGWRKVGRSYWKYGTGTVLIQRIVPQRTQRGWAWSGREIHPYEILDLANCAVPTGGEKIQFDLLSDAMNFVEQLHYTGALDSGIQP